MSVWSRPPVGPHLITLDPHTPRLGYVYDDAGVILWVLSNLHDARNCLGRYCIIHRPSRHHMSGWKLAIDTDAEGIFFRVCEHDAEHPDPDSLSYWAMIGKPLVHRCICNCCIPRHLRPIRFVRPEEPVVIDDDF